MGGRLGWHSVPRLPYALSPLLTFECAVFGGYLLKVTELEKHVVINLACSRRKILKRNSIELEYRSSIPNLQVSLQTTYLTLAQLKATKRIPHT